MKTYERGYLKEVMNKMNLNSIQMAYYKIWYQKNPIAIQIAVEYSMAIKENILKAFEGINGLKKLDKQIDEMINQ